VAGQIKEYNRIITRPRALIQVAHVRAAGKAMTKVLDEGLSEKDVYPFQLPVSRSLISVNLRSV